LSISNRFIKSEVLKLVISRNQQKQGSEKDTSAVIGQTTLYEMTQNQHLATSQLLKLSSAVLITKDYYSNFKKLMWFISMGLTKESQQSFWERHCYFALWYFRLSGSNHNLCNILCNSYVPDCISCNRKALCDDAHIN